MGVWFCTREDVKSALDVAETARSNWQIDDAIDAGARAVEGLTHRKFRPVLDTRHFAWPDPQRGNSWTLWLEQNELIRLDAFTSGGTAVDLANVYLEPNDGPPYTSLELNRATNVAFDPGAGAGQRANLATGLFGFDNVEEPVGVLAAGLGSSPVATASITWSSVRVGVGDVLRIDDERMTVAERLMVDTAQDLQADLAASSSSVTVAVSNGATFAQGQILLVDSERMLVVDVAGNNLTVKRAWDGSVLAAHSGSSIYTPTGVDVTRAALGTVLASHLSGAVIYRHIAPGLVRQLNKAEAINNLLQAQGGYASIQRSDTARQAGLGDSLPDLRAQVRRRYGRKMRRGVV